VKTEKIFVLSPQHTISLANEPHGNSLNSSIRHSETYNVTNGKTNPQYKGFINPRTSNIPQMSQQKMSLSTPVPQEQSMESNAATFSP
jgi:hypothetical protein